MLLFPAIDLYQGKAVRLYKGDYNQMTVYSEHPWEVAHDFEDKKASCIHLVDLEGAKNGDTPNIETVKRIVQETSLFSEIGGGIRSMQVIDKYLNAGVNRVILGTAAVTDRSFLEEAAKEFNEQLAVGVDIKDGFVAIKGWLEQSGQEAFAFCRSMQELGIRTIICTDISRDGAMRGTNLELYKQLSDTLSINITASGGVSSLEDVIKLRDMGLYGAIIGKAYYTGVLDLREAVSLCEA